ncbi:MAG: D-alanyl-D-alanine carboxypeptidase family protein [Candidatus Magasanikbacteria bacterium]
MDLKWQVLTLIIILLASLGLTQLESTEATAEKPKNKREEEAKTSVKRDQRRNKLLAFQQETSKSYQKIKNIPTRKWNVLDPEIEAEAVLAHSMDSNTPFFYKNVNKKQVLASLTKLITAVTVLEEVGLNKKIPITKEAVKTRGVSGQLKSGEVYTSKTLLKIMLLVSSNDAAAAFEEYLGGTKQFLKKAREKMKKIGMNSTKIYDGSGLSDSNAGTAKDLLKLSRYILKNHPKIFQWTRKTSILAQPINGVETKKILNINPLVNNQKFLGGKTGTSKAAGENILTLYKIKNRKALIILLDSDNRDKEAKELVKWIKKAYQF